MSEYQEWTQDFDNREKALKSASTRFVKYEERRNESVLTLKDYEEMASGKYKTTWRGVELMQASQDLVILQHLLWDLKPASIFEIGTYAGGSALWVSDHMKMYGYTTHIYSVDKDTSMVRDLAKEDTNITFIECDAKEIEKAFPKGFLQGCPHPWLFLEDAHDYMTVCLEHFDKFLVAGDYVCVEDGSVHTSVECGMGLETAFKDWGDYKLSAMKEFIINHPDKYMIDTYYTDFYGYNGTSHWNGLWKRV